LACFLRRLTLSSPLAAERKERRQSRCAGSSIRSARGSPDWRRPCLHHGPRRLLRRPSSRPEAARSFEPRRSPGLPECSQRVCVGARLHSPWRCPCCRQVGSLRQEHADVLHLVHEPEEKGASRGLEPAIDTGGPMGRMVLTGLCRVAEMSLASSVIGNAPASTPRRRRAFTRVILSLSTERALSSRARKGCPNVQATGSTQPRGAPSPFVMLGVALPRRDDCGSRVLFPPLARDARQRGETTLARCPAPSSRARGLC
jgi:hypothetical protein